MGNSIKLFDVNKKPSMSVCKIKFFSNWCPNKQLHEQWCHSLTPNGKGQWITNNNDLFMTIQAVEDAQEADYHIVINYPKLEDVKTLVPEKIIVLPMEPLGWRNIQYPKAWNPPNRLKYKYIHNRMSTEWHLTRAYDEMMKELSGAHQQITKNKIISTVMSNAQTLPGQKLRCAFLPYLEKIHSFEYWGKDASNSKHYKGALPPLNKDKGLIEYKYTFAAENSSESGYFTEKLIDAILCECLTFYGNAPPDIEKYIDSRAYICIDLNKPEEALQKIKDAISNDEYTQRLPFIREAKRKILNELQIFPMLTSIIANIHQQETFFNRKVSCYYVNLDRDIQRRQRCEEQLKVFGIKGQRWPATDGRLLSSNNMIESGFITNHMSEKNNMGVLGYISTSIKLWKHIADAPEEKDKLYLILEDDFRFHPHFMELFPIYYEHLPIDRELVYFGATSPDLNGANNENSLCKYVNCINTYIAKCTHILQGCFAYAITSRCAKKLLSQLPLSRPVDYFPPDKTINYILRRPQPLSVDDSFYINKSTWNGHHTIILHGLISVFEVESTINHSNPEANKPLIKEVMEQRYRGRYHEAYKILQQMKPITEEKANKGNFHYYDEMAIICYHLDDHYREGLQALKELVNNYDLYAKPILHYRERLLKNILSYQEDELHEELQGKITSSLQKIEEKKSILLAAANHANSRILVTACDSRFFNSVKTQIASAHRHSFQDFDLYYVFNLGLKENEIAELENYAKVAIMRLGEAFNIGSFAWKLAIFQQLSTMRGNFMYLDAGAMYLGNVSELFHIIEEYDLFLCEDDSQYNYTWTTPDCVRAMGVNERELHGYQLCAGITGLKGGGRYSTVISQAYFFSKNPACIEGARARDYGSFQGKPIRGHRHDQSILSILKERYNLPTQNIARYGAWQSYDYARESGALIYVHRGEYSNHSGLVR